ncbi:hypothetical protein WJ438_40190 [Streptomyces sp. GD-15H]|uniref:hypothetical protein n=1 Tax=Streptomyces sp. GD-15H TaxID=3129112 RepID=UPI00324EF4D9
MTDNPVSLPQDPVPWLPKIRNQYQLDLAILATIQQAIAQVIPPTIGEKAAGELTTVAAGLENSDRELAPHEVMQQLSPFASVLQDFPDLCPPLKPKFPPWPPPWPEGPVPPPGPWPWPGPWPPGPYKDVVPVQALPVLKAAQEITKALGDQAAASKASEVLGRLRSALVE